ncbi:MAG: 4-alpha-glucanotransferase [Sphaerochaetaceae bacterium]|nr:4-alpha-glucanotransferase [Sphaerochaetaceae bacterium]
MRNKSRHAGVLLHISSLAGAYGIGDFGPSAYEFADCAASCGFRYWQMLPLGPTGYGNSPYSALSAFAGNEALISPEILRDEGYLTDEELRGISSAFSDVPSNHVDFVRVKEYKLPLIEKAASRALLDPSFLSHLEEFSRKNSYWLDDYALFYVLNRKYRDSRWYSIWDGGEGFRDPEALKKVSEAHEKEIKICKAMQLFFQKQCTALNDYLHLKGLKSIGDIPIFVGKDSADAWSCLELFKTDGKGHFTEVSGVPPDNFCEDGQLWGTPVYDWDYHLKTDFSWWVSRIRRCFELNDIIRIDHFRGFDAYYAIPSDAETARHGVWTHSPGRELFTALKKNLGDLPIIAEDLGNITAEVRRLRKDFSMPGMKIAQFGFELTRYGKIRLSHEFLPRNYTRSFVAYTGTHDNDTTCGWFSSIPENLKKAVLSYLGTDEEGVTDALIESVLLSRADTAVIPAQDILKLDTRARMNYPSTCNDINWSWRMEKNTFPQESVSFYRGLIEKSGRL